MTPKIVNIDGLADVLICSKDILLKSWRQYPHFFIGQGDTAKGARFDAEDVIQYLKARDYANVGQTDKKLRWKGQDHRTPSKNTSGFPHKGRGQKVGAECQIRSQRNPTYASAGDPFDLLRGVK